MIDWPKHPDGRNKRMGEMTLAEQREQIRKSRARLNAECSDQARQAELAKAIKDWKARFAALAEGGIMTFGQET